MDELLTVRQLQDMLSVDRITIYRMLDAGQLPGFKVGGQWRFSRKEIETWLECQRGLFQPAELGGTEEEGSLSAQSLPLSCMEPIQEIFADAMHVAAFTADPEGQPLIRISNSSSFCGLVQSTPEGQRRCMESCQTLAQARNPMAGVECHAGLRLVGCPVEVNGKRVALVVAEQFSVGPGGSESVARRLPTLAEELGLEEGQLRAVCDQLYELDEMDVGRVTSLLQKVAVAFSELGLQRVLLLGRLQQIADIAKLP